MADPFAESTVAGRLGDLVDRGLLPAGGPTEVAERLIERLGRPARVALLGLPGAGKSAILNLLAGTVVVPETLRLPSIMVQHGTRPQMLCTLASGQTEVVPGCKLEQILPLNPALVTMEMDLPALKVISLLEVSAGPMEAEQRRAAIWASKRAEIVIWCSTSFLPKEQAVWEAMPDAVKDNGFLFLTKVDLLESREAADGMLERVEQRAGDEFRQVLSISARQARAAAPPGGPMNRDLFRDSGAAAVILAIKTRVQTARRADMDMAELLIARHGEAGTTVARRRQPEDDVPQWTPPPDTPATPMRRAATGDRDESAAAGPAAPRERRSAPAEQAGKAPVEGDERRFVERIKQLPLPKEVREPSGMPLRTTWKSSAAKPVAGTESMAGKAPSGGRRAARDDSRIEEIVASLTRAAPEPTEAEARPPTPPQPPTLATDNRPLRAGPFGRGAVAGAGAMNLASPRPVEVREQRAETGSAERRERPRIAARAATTAAGPSATVQLVSPAEQGLLQAAATVILSRSADLSARIDPAGKAPVDLILEHARQTTEEVMAMLGRGTSEGLRRINADLGEVLDLITLMQLEKGHAPADDVLTLLLQIRQEVETLGAK